MKPDIIRYNDLRIIEGYVGVICERGNVLHIRNISKEAGRPIVIECPCGFNITTIYTKERI